MAQTVAGLAPVLKEVYHPKMYKTINESDITWTDLKRRFEAADMDGSKYVWPLHTGRSRSGRFISEQGTIPQADRQKTKRAEADAQQVIQSITVTKKSKDRSKTNRGSYVQSLPFEIEGAVADMINRMNRASYGQGSFQTATPTVLRTGKIARVQAKAGNVLTLGESAGSLLTAGEMRYFFSGMGLASVTPGTGAVTEAEAIVEGVDEANSQITVDDATNILVADILVEGDVDGNSYDLEYPGLRVLINDNAGDQLDGSNAIVIHNLSSDDTPAWQSQKVSGPISDKLLQDSWTKILTSGDGNRYGDADLVIGSHEQQDELANQLTALRRYEGRTTKLQTGWDALVLAKGHYVPSRYCPTNDGFRLNTNQMAWLVAADFDWDTEDGGEILLRSQTTLEYLARYVGDLSMIALTRGSHTRIAFDAIA